MSRTIVRRLFKERDAISAPLFALCLPFILGLLALAVDMSLGYFARSKLQSTVDGAALAAASQLDPSVAVVTMQANARSEANLYADTKNIGYVQDGDVTDEIVVILVTNVVGAIQESPGWLFSGIVVGVILCGSSYTFIERRRSR